MGGGVLKCRSCGKQLQEHQSVQIGADWLVSPCDIKCPLGEIPRENSKWSREAEVHNQKKVGMNANVTSFTPTDQSQKSKKLQFGSSG